MPAAISLTEALNKWTIKEPTSYLQYIAVNKAVTHELGRTWDAQNKHNNVPEFDEWRSILTSLRNPTGFGNNLLDAFKFVLQNADSFSISLGGCTGTYGVRLRTLQSILVAAQVVPVISVGFDFSEFINGSPFRREVVGIEAQWCQLVYHIFYTNDYGHVEFISEPIGWSTMFFDRDMNKFPYIIQRDISNKMGVSLQ